MKIEKYKENHYKVDEKYYVRLPFSFTRDQANNAKASCTCPNAYDKVACEHIQAAYNSTKV